MMPNIVANDGNKFAFLTNSNAPKNKLILDTSQIKSHVSSTLPITQKPRIAAEA
uniref:Uncharacterized protein n=1 Tax=Oryza rufipogon TaxID=4529 RepID=A0A0E0P849_ORYRU